MLNGHLNGEHNSLIQSSTCAQFNKIMKKEQLLLIRYRNVIVGETTKIDNERLRIKKCLAVPR
jgi:hypothetical protein